MNDYEITKNAFQKAFKFLRIELDGSNLNIYSLDNDLIISYNLDIYNTSELLIEINKDLYRYNQAAISQFTFIDFQK